MLNPKEIKLNRILHGKNQDVLKDFPDSFFDSVITDPPYELNFCGKSWDNTGVAYNVAMWREVLRVAKPGATLFCFGGTRTYHRVACAIEDAGWQLKDSLMWIYGCLSSDTEILTADGWKKYHKDICNDSVLCYDIAADKFKFDKPSQSFNYENEHTAFRIQSRDTDQIVSRNHRCIVERDGVWVFKRAEMCKNQEDIPFLESLQSLPEAVYDVQPHTSTKECDLFQELRSKSASTSGAQEDEASKRTWRKIQSYLRNMWQRILQKHKATCQSWSDFLINAMQWRSSWRRMETVGAYGSMGLDRRVTTKCQFENDRTKQSCVERRSDVLQKEWQLWSICDKVCQVPKRVLRYVSQGRVRNGAQTDNRSTARQVFDSTRSGSPYRSQPGEQCDRELDAVREQSETQVVRSTRATITPIEYRGKVWCVQVSTGAFVARRNGKIFITGNSGFPKSMDISKALDKEAGATREVVKIRTDGNKGGGVKTYDDDAYVWDKPFAETQPATDIAKQWQGMGTALKPAFEPIILAMKPLEKGLTYAQNARKHGVAGLNIDAGRISSQQGEYDVRHYTKESCFMSDGSKKKSQFQIKPQPSGRWPANIILSHSPDCVHVGTQQIAGSSGVNKVGEAGISTFSDKHNATKCVGRSKETRRGLGVETIDVYACVSDCPIRIMDTQSEKMGIHSAGYSTNGVHCGNKKSHGGKQGGIYGEYQAYPAPRFGDAGGASRFFYTAKASRSERESGLKDFVPCAQCGEFGTEKHKAKTSTDPDTGEQTNRPVGNCIRNNHPTVKPVAIMKYLCELIRMPARTDADGNPDASKAQVILDPFCGSGTTLLAADEVGLKYIGIDMGLDNVLIASSRSIDTPPDDEQTAPLDSIDIAEAAQDLSLDDFDDIII